MSSQHLEKLDAELQKAYNAVLLQIFDGLETDQQAKLYFTSPDVFQYKLLQLGTFFARLKMLKKFHASTYVL